MARFESCPDIIVILTLIYSRLFLSQEFARRALTKINELSQLEAMSSHKESKDVEEIFRYATVKVGTADVTMSQCLLHQLGSQATARCCSLQMAVMVYKRAVFERRKAPKGILRPKTRTNLKDAAGVSGVMCGVERVAVRDGKRVV